jgi:hypothetical protein
MFLSFQRIDHHAYRHSLNPKKTFGINTSNNGNQAISAKKHTVIKLDSVIARLSIGEANFYLNYGNRIKLFLTSS